MAKVFLLASLSPNMQCVWQKERKGEGRERKEEKQLSPSPETKVLVPTCPHIMFCHLGQVTYTRVHNAHLKNMENSPD